MNYYNRHIGDYAKDAGHLTLLEDGIYGRLMDAYYAREGPLPDAEVERLVRARTPVERKACRSVLAEFFALTDGHWSHKRCNREISYYRKKADIARENGGRGGRPKTQRVPENNPSGYDKITQRVPTANPEITGSQAPSSQEPITSNQQPNNTPPTPTPRTNPPKEKPEKLLATTIPPRIEDVILHGSRMMMPEEMCRAFFDWFESNGWKVGKAKAPMRNWQSALNNWKRNQPNFTGATNGNGTNQDRRNARDAVDGRRAAKAAREYPENLTL